ncbi:hypothetical protein [Uliginosibacterium aquaticum]|nr:hypothetical protein [Uliginosibacterium aquaticum]
MKSLLKFVLCLMLTGSAMAQTDPVRPIPDDALKAEMQVIGERQLKLNNLSVRLSVGGVIVNQNNLVVLTQSLGSSTYVVRVKFNAQGEAQKVWILTAAEDAVAAPKLKSDTPWWKLF